MPHRELPPVKEWFGRGGQAMSDAEVESEDMVHVRQRTYDLKCNWKVYNDNYLVSVRVDDICAAQNISQEPVSRL